MPQSLHLRAVRPRLRSISISVEAPRFTCTETASAPMRIASSTSVTSTFESGSGLSDVLAERWTISPMSFPEPRCPATTMPLWTMIALAPPVTMRSTVVRMSSSPRIGPRVMPWSIGTMTVRPELRLMIRSSRIFLPIILWPPEPRAARQTAARIFLGLWSPVSGLSRRGPDRNLTEENGGRYNRFDLIARSGGNSVVEWQLPKLHVEGSSPFRRSMIL